MPTTAASLARELERLRKADRDKGSKPQLGRSSIVNGRIVEYDINETVKQIIGKQADGTNTTVQVNGPIPPAPAAPDVIALTEAAQVVWDGTWAGGAVAPMDLARIDVHVTPGAGDDPLMTPAVASITAQGWGEANFPLAAGTYHAHLVARTTSGKFRVSDVSAPFTTLSVVIPEPSDGQPPAGAPLVELIEGIGSVFLKITPPANPDPITDFGVYVNGALASRNASTLVAVEVDAAGMDLPLDADTSIQVTAWDLDGEGPKSVTVSGRPRAVGADQLTDAVLQSIQDADDRALAATQAAEEADAAAQAAAQAAQTAQNAADGAIRTYYQPNAPTGLNDTTDLGDLWFDTDNSQASRWGGSGPGWVLIRDNGIAEALSKAADALAAANAASTAASVAQAAANGKNTNTYGPTPLGNPPAAGRIDGDIHFIRTSGAITGQQRLVGGSWVAEKIDGAVLANLDAGTITAGYLNVALLIRAGAIASTQLGADVATIEDLTAGFVMTGKISVGVGYWSKAEGIVIPQPDGGEIRLPVDGVTPATITAKLTARSLTVERDLNILGTTNKLSGQLTLSNGVTRPTTPPSLSAYYPSVPTFDPSSLGPTWYGAVRSLTNASAIITANAFFGGAINEFVEATGQTGFQVAPAWGSGNFNPFGGITAIGDSYYVLGKHGERGDAWYVYRLNSAYEKTGEIYLAADSFFSGRPAIGTDGVNVLVGFAIGDALRVHRYPADMSGTTSPLPVAGSARPHVQTIASVGPASRAISFVGEGTYDFGAQTIVMTAEMSGTVVATGVTSATPAAVSANAFPNADGGSVRGVAFVGGAFKSLDTTGRWATYSPTRTQTTVGGSYSWYDGVGTVRETQDSDAATLALPARAWLRVESGFPPDSGNTGANVDKANRVGIYLGINGAARRLQAYLGVDATSGISVREYRTGTITATGALAQTTNGFTGAATGSPGSIITASGTGSWYGDNSGKIGPITFSENLATVPNPGTALAIANKQFVDTSVAATPVIEFIGINSGGTVASGAAATVISTFTPNSGAGRPVLTATRGRVKATSNAWANGNQDCNWVLQYSLDAGSTWTTIDQAYHHNNASEQLPLGAAMDGWFPLPATRSNLRFRVTLQPGGGGFGIKIGAVSWTAYYWM